MTSIESAIDTLVSEIKHMMYNTKDVNKLSNTELFDILNKRIEGLEDPQLSYLENRYNEIGRKVIPHMTGEQISFCIGDKSDKDALLSNFCDQDLLLELFSRDVNIGTNLSESQAEELLTSLLQCQLSDEMEKDLTTYVSNNVDTNTLLEQIDEEALLEAVIERCPAFNILTALARTL